MTVFVVTSQVDYYERHIEGVWEERSDAESWIKMMRESWDNVGDYHTIYYINEYNVK